MTSSISAIGPPQRQTPGNKFPTSILEAFALMCSARITEKGELNDHFLGA
jgi:hypothetical protein